MTDAAIEALRSALSRAERALQDARTALYAMEATQPLEPPPAGQRELLTPADAAERLRASVATLARWRGDGTGPRYIKRRGRIFYRESDIEEWEADAARVKTRG